MNKKGYVLVYALGIITVLMILVASLSKITMQRSNQSNKNAFRVEETNKAIATVEAASSDLAEKLNDLNNEPELLQNYKYLTDLSVHLNAFFNTIQTNYGVTIRNISDDTCVNPATPSSCYLYTNEYEIIYEAKDFSATKRFFLSMIPSFLYFSIGSNQDVTINGAAYIDGNAYVKNNLYLSNVTNYSRNNIPNQEESYFLTVSPNRTVYVNQNLYSCQFLKDCYQVDTVNNTFTRDDASYRVVSNESFYSTTFTNNPPSIMTYNDRFLDVNYDASFSYYLNESIDDQDSNLDLSNIGSYSTVNDYLHQKILNYEAQGWLTDVTSDADLSNNTGSLVYFGDTTFSNNMAYSKDEWIIIDGDLTIEQKNIDRILIDANILVNGNITITGNIAFDSTIYAYGTGTIEDASISGIDNNQLVLLTKNDLHFTAINTFRNNFSEHVTYFPSTGQSTIKPHIKGFFYTDQKAEVYAAASYIVIEGGLFTNQELIINSFRGQVSSDFSFTKSNRVEQSRFVIKHNIDTIKNQPKGLPINKQFNYIFEGVIIK